MPQREYVDLLKHIKIMKAAPTCLGLKETIIRKPQTVLRKKYRPGSM